MSRCERHAYWSKRAQPSCCLLPVELRVACCTAGRLLMGQQRSTRRQADQGPSLLTAVAEPCCQRNVQTPEMAVALIQAATAVHIQSLTTRLASSAAIWQPWSCFVGRTAPVIETLGPLSSPLNAACVCRQHHHHGQGARGGSGGAPGPESPVRGGLLALPGSQGPFWQVWPLFPSACCVTQALIPDLCAVGRCTAARAALHCWAAAPSQPTSGKRD